jgi:hypothetical protein
VAAVATSAPLAGHRGVLCFDRSRRGRKVAYTHPRRLFPGFRPVESVAHALAELVRSYLHAYGPATPEHFAKWLVAPKRWAAELFSSVSERGVIDEVAVEWGGTAWQVAGEEPSGTEAPRGRPAAAVLRRVRHRVPAS